MRQLRKQGRKTSSCEWVVFKWSMRSFADWPPYWPTVQSVDWPPIINKNLSSFENLSDPKWPPSLPLKLWSVTRVSDWVNNHRKSLSCYSQLKSWHIDEVCDVWDVRGSEAEYWVLLSASCWPHKWAAWYPITENLLRQNTQKSSVVY